MLFFGYFFPNIKPSETRWLKYGKRHSFFILCKLYKLNYFIRSSIKLLFFLFSLDRIIQNRRYAGIKKFIDSGHAIRFIYTATKMIKNRGSNQPFNGKIYV